LVGETDPEEEEAEDDEGGDAVFRFFDVVDEDAGNTQGEQDEAGDAVGAGLTDEAEREERDAANGPQHAAVVDPRCAGGQGGVGNQPGRGEGMKDAPFLK